MGTGCRIKPGNKYHILVNPGKKYKIHILAVIETDMIVYKYYGRYQQWWHYIIEHRNILEIKIQRSIT